jgi:hypothetical protein
MARPRARTFGPTLTPQQIRSSWRFGIVAASVFVLSSATFAVAGAVSGDPLTSEIAARADLDHRAMLSQRMHLHLKRLQTPR